MRNRTRIIFISLTIVMIAVFAIQIVWSSYSYRQEQSVVRLQANSIIHSVLSEQQWNKGREWIQNIRDTYGEEVMPMIGSKDYKTYVITYYIYNTETGKHDKYEGQCSSFREILEYDTGAGEYHIIGLDLELLEKNLRERFAEYGISTPFILEKVKMATGEVFERNRDKRLEDYTHLCDTIKLGVTFEDGLVVKFDGSYRQVVRYLLSHNILSIFILLLTLGVTIILVKVLHYQGQTFRFREDFVRYMVHEIKNPLACIRHYFELSAPEDNRGAQIANKGVDELTSLVEKILVTTSDKLYVHRESIDVRAMLRQIAESFPQADITLSIEDGIEMVYADKLHYSNAVKNLVDNAVKYSLDDKRVEIRCYRDDDMLCVSVRDWGVGIPRMSRSLIYSRYVRLDNHKRDVKGFGLGLSYVHLVAQSFGGSIAMEECGGVGSKFVLKIPYDND